ncbi:hypothetical protein BpHYR1_024309 [Brachionus plicatilis]|uniref:Uncharacterized protein n=1 Tax=Brachionus plicatilis TaxID=10195 RepID=A0A3M7SD65_BRAPC|nr:hypothetical protein BpHYR1_024309 [Brachionus plicatilis]
MNTNVLKAYIHSEIEFFLFFLFRVVLLILGKYWKCFCLNKLKKLGNKNSIEKKILIQSLLITLGS